jgi:hypothetical protein
MVGGDNLLIDDVNVPGDPGKETKSRSGMQSDSGPNPGPPECAGITEPNDLETVRKWISQTSHE